MKKAMTLALAALLLLGLCACGAKSAETAAEPTEEPTAVPTEESTDSPTEAPTADPTAEPTAAPEPGLTDLTGEMIGEREYVNPLFSLGFAPGEGWTFLTDEELQELSGVTAQMVGDEELSEQLSEAYENGTTIYGMFAMSPDGLKTVNLGLEKLNAVAGILYSEERYLNTAAPQLEQALASMGMTDVSYEIGSVEVAGKEFPCVRLQGEYGGMTVYELLFVKKQSGTMGVITLTSFGEEVGGELLSAWYALD